MSIIVTVSGASAAVSGIVLVAAVIRFFLEKHSTTIMRNVEKRGCNE